MAMILGGNPTYSNQDPKHRDHRNPNDPVSILDGYAETSDLPEKDPIKAHGFENPPTRPSPRQGRRLGPPEVWNLLCHGHGLHIVQGRSCNKCLSVFKRFATLQRPHLPAHMT